MRRQRQRLGWSNPGPVFGPSPRVRLATTAFLIWWGAVVATVALDRSATTSLLQLAVLTALLLAVVLPRRRASVVATPLGLRVNNGWRERCLRWREVAAFRAGPGGEITAVLHTGEQVTLGAARCSRLVRAHRRRRQIHSRRDRLAGYQTLMGPGVDQLGS